MDNFRILAVVKFNNGEALVLDRKLELVYTKYGNKTIVGTDGIFYQCYYHDCRGGMNAFAGREFDLTMEDGEIVHCNGQWWSGITKEAQEIIGEEIVWPIVESLSELSKCYVFCGYTANKDKYKALRRTYTGTVFECNEFRDIFIRDVQKKPYELYSQVRDDRDFRIKRFKRLVARLKDKQR